MRRPEDTLRKLAESLTWCLYAACFAAVGVAGPMAGNFAGSNTEHGGYMAATLVGCVWCLCLLFVSVHWSEWRRGVLLDVIDWAVCTLYARGTNRDSLRIRWAVRSALIFTEGVCVLSLEEERVRSKAARWSVGWRRLRARDRDALALHLQKIGFPRLADEVALLDTPHG